MTNILKQIEKEVYYKAEQIFPIMSNTAWNSQRIKLF